MTKNRALRSTAALLSIALIQAAFGPAAWAHVARVSGLSAPVGGSAASAAGASANANAGASASLSVVSMSGAPIFAPAPAVSAPAGLMTTPAASIASPAAASASENPEAAATPEANGSAEAASAEASNSTAADIPAAAFTGRAGGRISRVIAQVRGLFASKDTGAIGASAAPTALNGSDPAEPANHVLDLAPSAKGAAQDKVAQGGGDNAPPAPAPNDEGPAGPKKKLGWFGLGATVATLLGAMLTMQVGLEAQGAAMAQLTEDAFGDFSILAQVSIFAQLGSMVGQQLAPAAISRLGLAKTYYAAHFLRALSIGTMIFLIGSGLMPLSLMYVFYAANGVMTGIAATADGTMRKIIIGSAPGSQERFRTIWQFTAEIIGVIAPIAFSALVVSIGPSLVTGIYPATIIAALMILIAKKILPKDAAQKLADAGKAAVGGDVASATKKGGFGEALKAMWRTMVDGKNIVMGNPVLKWSFLGAATFDIMNVFLYRLFAPGYGKLVAGAAGMSPIAGMVVGLFSLGGLITAVMLLAMQRKLKKQIVKKIGLRQTVKDIVGSASEAVLHPISSLRTLGRGIKKAVRAIAAVIAHPVQSLRGLKALVQQRMKAPGAKSEQVSVQNEQEATEAQRKSVLRWTLLGAPAVLLLATFALSLPPLAGALTVPAAAMVVFGFFQVAASIKLNAFFIDNLPDPEADPANKDKVQHAIAFEGSAMTAMSIIGMLAMKPMFGHLEPRDLDFFNPFPWIAAATIPLALALFVIQRKLAAATKTSK